MVDYYLKYLKYKNKYLKLVNIYGGSDEAEAELQESNSRSRASYLDDDEPELQDPNSASQVPDSASQVPYYGYIVIQENTPHIGLNSKIKSYINELLDNYLNNNRTSDLNDCITKFITYNTLEQNMATLFNGRSITTVPSYQELNSMFEIYDCTKKKYVPLSEVINYLFNFYRSPNGLSNTDKNITRAFYNNEIVASIQHSSKIFNLFLKYHNHIINNYNKDNKQYNVIIANIINIEDWLINFAKYYYTINDLITILKNILENNSEFKIKGIDNNYNIIDKYKLSKSNTKKNNILINYDLIINNLKLANDIIVNTEKRLALVLGRLLDAITPNSIVAVEEISQCLFTHFMYKGQLGTLLDHFNNIGPYCCVINPDHDKQADNYTGTKGYINYNDYLANDKTYWGGSSLFIPCNYFNGIILTQHIYYVLTIDKNPCETSHDNINFHFNPKFNDLIMEALDTTDTIVYKNKTYTSKRTLMYINYTNNTSPEIIISGHLETDSVEPVKPTDPTQNFKVRAFKKIKDLIKKITRDTKLYVMGDFNYEFKNIKNIFNDLQVLTNNYDDENLTSYEQIELDTSGKFTIKQKNIDYLITNNITEIIKPIFNKISYNIISNTGTDHKMVSFIKINIANFVNKLIDNIPESSEPHNKILIESYIKNLILSIEDDSTYKSFPNTIKLK